MTTEIEQQHTAANLARNACDDERLAEVRRAAFRMSLGTASIRETRGAVAMIVFLLHYIDLVDERWRARIEDEVTDAIKRRDDARRMRTIQRERTKAAKRAEKRRAG